MHIVHKHYSIYLACVRVQAVANTTVLSHVDSYSDCNKNNLVHYNYASCVTPTECACLHSLLTLGF